MFDEKRPYIVTRNFPEEEQDSIHVIGDSLDRIYSYLEAFHAVVLLFDFCENAETAPVTQTITMRDFIRREQTYDNQDLLSQWKRIAARDGIMTIYHVFKTTRLSL